MAKKPTPPGPGKPGRKWAGKRRYSTEQLVKIATKHNAWLMIPDYWISQRKRRHVLFDSQGEQVLVTQQFSDMIARIREEGVFRVIMIMDDLPKPAFCRIKDSTDIFYGRSQNGKSLSTTP